MSEGARKEIERIEREEFARGHVPPGAPPVPPRPAATVVLARPGGTPFEVLLLRRPDTARFAARAYVFPGGVIDPADGDPALEAILGSGYAGKEPAALAAGLRELFEETGLLPADALPPRERLREAREALLSGERTFPEVVADLGLTFRSLTAVYVARWVTPERLARRYDTRFFLAIHRQGEPELTREHTDFLWTTPSDGVSRFGAGELPMLFPTWKTLERLSRFGGLTEAVAALRRAPVESIRPRLIVRGDRVRPVLPGDPGYEEGR